MTGVQTCALPISGQQRRRAGKDFFEVSDHGWVALDTAVHIALGLLPEFLVLKYNVPFYFGGTSLLIIVVVTMDFWAQVQSYVMSQQYESLLKKANFKAS